MTIAWMILIAGLALAVALIVGSRVRRNNDLDLGTVSTHWIAERRLGQRHDGER